MQTGLEDGVDYTSQIQTFADNFTDLHSSLFIAQGLHWNGLFFFVMLAINIVSQLFSRETEFDVWPIGKLVFRWAMLHLAILYWDTPVWNDVPVHRIIAHQMTQIASKIDMTIVDEFNIMVQHIRGAVDMPGSLNVLGGIAYYVFQWMMGTLQGATFLVTSAAYPLLSVAYLVGPLAIACFMLPWFAFIGSGLVRFILIYSFARVAGNSLVWIWCHILAWFFSTVFGVGDEPISLGTMLYFSPVIGILTAGFFWSVFQVFSIGRDIFHGTASVGSTLTGIAGGNAALQRLVIAFA